MEKSDFILASKILFIIVATMIIISVNNSVTLPAGELIYGRF